MTWYELKFTIVFIDITEDAVSEIRTETTILLLRAFEKSSLYSFVYCLYKHFPYSSINNFNFVYYQNELLLSDILTVLVMFIDSTIICIFSHSSLKNTNNLVYIKGSKYTGQLFRILTNTGLV